MYGFLSGFGTFLHKEVPTCFVMLKTWDTTLFGTYDCVKMSRIEYNSHMLKITC